jgi:ABC-2 type transport system ATP-binding protein
MWDYVQELHAKGTTIILTTHYLEEAEALCDRVAIIDQGEIVANDETKTLLSRLDQRTLIVSPETELTALPQSLTPLDASLKPNGDIAINYRSGTTRVTALIEQIRSSGIAIADLRTEQPDLEDVFMSLTYDREGHVATT